MDDARATKLIDHYIDECDDRYGVRPLVNRNAATIAMRGMLQDLDMETATSLVSYFAENYPAKDFRWFTFNYELVYVRFAESEKTKRDNRRIAEETRIRTEQWNEKRKRLLNERTKSNQRDDQEQ